MDRQTVSPATPWPEIDDQLPLDARVELTTTPGWYIASRPTIDYIAAVLLLAVFFPVIGTCWLLTRLTSRGPGFYTQTRSGEGGRNYRIVKIRTMRHNVEAVSGIQWAKRQDTRTTWLGKFLRATHLDELPQLFNVLRGEMSLVGPRPERPEVIRSKGLAAMIPGYSLRLSVRPGVTGLAQLQLPADSDVASVRRKVVYDLYYIQNRTLWLDVRIVAATALKAAGLGPAWLQRIFRLPNRNEVAQFFHETLVVPNEPLSSGSARLQPV